MAQDLMFRILGDSTSHERALARSEAAQRRYDVAILRARGDMDRDLAGSMARQDALHKQSIARQDQVGASLLKMGAAGAIGLGLLVNEAVQWESAWAGVTKTVDQNSPAFDTLEQDLRDLAKTLPATHEEIAAVAEAAGALGVETPAVVQFTRTMIDLAETTDLTAEQAATSIAKLAEVMGTDLTNEVDNLGNALVALGNNGASTESQILEMSQRLAVAGNIAHLSEADVLGFASALTSVGINAEAGGTAFSKVFVAIDDSVKAGGESLETFALVAGLSVDEFKRAFQEDAAGATTTFVEGLGRMSDSGMSLTATLDELGLGEERTRQSLLALAGATGFLREQVILSNEEYETGNALQEEAAKRYETTAAKTQIALNNIKDAAIEFGGVLLPIVADVAGGIASIATGFGNLPAPVKTALTALAGLVTTGALVVGAGLKIHAALDKITGSLEPTSRLAKSASLGLKGLGALSIAAGIVGTALAIEQLWLAMEGDQLDTEGLEGDLLRLSAGLDATGNLAETFGKNLSDLGPVIADAATGWDVAIGSFGKEAGVRAVENLDAALATLIRDGHVEEAVSLFEGFADAAATQGATLSEVKDVFPDYQKELGRAAADAEIAATATDELAGSTEGVISPTESLTDALDKQATELDALITAWDELNGVHMGAAEAEAAYQQAIDDTTEAIKAQRESTGGLADALNDTMTGFDLTTQSGRDLQDVLFQQAETAAEAATAARDLAIVNGTDVTDANAAMITSLDQSRAGLSLTLQEMGIGKGAADALALSILAVPDLTTTQVDIEVAEAKRLAEEHEARLVAITKVRETKLNADPNGAISGVATANTEFDKLPSSITVPINVPIVIDWPSELNYPGSASLPGHAQGAYVTDEHIARVGEKGPEWILPDSKLRDFAQEILRGGRSMPANSPAMAGAMAGTTSMPAGGYSGPAGAGGTNNVYISNPVMRSSSEMLGQAQDVTLALAR